MDWNVAATKIEEIARSVGLNALDYVPDDMPNTAFYVGEMDVEPNQSFNKTLPDGTRAGIDKADITCRVLVARSSDKGAIRKLRQYGNGSGDKSLIEAIQKTNGQPDAYPWSGIVVRSVRTNRLFVVGESKFYGTEFELSVIGAA
jgi:hypothetical protein